MIEVKFDLNIKDITEKLEKFEKNVQKKLVRKAMREGAKVILEDAKARVPVKSGNLKKSFGINTRTKKGNVTMYISPRTGKGVKYDGFYGIFVELGHPIVKKVNGKKVVVGHAAPHPFLRPAFEAKGKEAIDVFRKKLRELINEYRG